MKLFQKIAVTLLVTCATSALFGMNSEDQKDTTRMTPQELTTLVSGEPVHPQVINRVEVREPFYNPRLTVEELLARVSGEPVANIDMIRLAPREQQAQRVITGSAYENLRDRAQQALLALVAYYTYMNARRAGSPIKH